MAVEVLERVGQIYISDSTVWRQTQRWGDALTREEDVVIEKASQPLTVAEMKKKGQSPTRKKGVALDGGFINIRGEGWKEFKVGTVFDVEVTPTKNKATGKWDSKAHATNCRYVAHLGGPERVGELLWAEARGQGWPSAVQTVMLGDGASWIWRIRQRHFASSKELVDWYHAADHLHQAQALLFPTPSKQAEAWYRSQADLLFAGRAPEVADTLWAAAAGKPAPVAQSLSEQATYFANNQARMNYQALQQAGFPIGSGMIESGCKQFKVRFCGPGMRWSVPGVKRLLPIRSAVLSGSFEDRWKQVFHSPPN